MARLLGALRVNMDADSSRFVRGVREADRAISRFERNIKRDFALITRTMRGLQFFMGIEIVQATGRMIQAVAGTTDELGKFATRIGISTEELSKLQYAAQASGVSIAQLNMSLQRQTRRISEAAIGTGEAQKALKEMGLSAQELANMSPDEQILKLADAFEKVSNKGDQVRLAMKLWDSEGVAMLQMVKDGAEGINRMRKRLEELGGVVGPEMAQRQADFNDAWNDFKVAGMALLRDVLTPLQLGLTAVMQTVTLLGKAWKEFKEFFNLDQTNVKKLEGVKSQIDTLAEQLAEATRRAKEYEKAGLIPQFEQTMVRVVDLKAKIGDLMLSYNQLKEETEGTKEETKGLTDGLEPLLIHITNADARIEDLVKEIREMERALEVQPRLLKEINDWFLELPPEEAAEKISILNELMERYGEKTEASFDQAKSSALTFTELMKNQIRRLDDAFVNFWVSIIEGSENAWDAMKRAAIQAIAEIIHHLTTKNLTKIITEALTPKSTTGGSKTGEGETPQTWSQRLSQGIGAVFGSVGGAIVGTAIGSFIGGLLGSGDNKVKETQFIGGNFRGPLRGKLAAVSTESPFGPYLGMGFHRLGNEGQMTDAEAVRLLNELKGLQEIVVEIDAAIAKTLDAAQMEEVEKALRRLDNATGDWDPMQVDKVIRGRFKAIFSTIDESLGEAFDQWANVLTGDELLQYVADFTKIYGIFEQGHQIFSDVADAAETVNILMGEMAQYGEGLAEVLERMTEATTILAALGLDELTVEQQKFNLDVSDIAGGNQNLRDLVDSFLDGFIPTEDQLLRKQKQLQGILPALLDELGTTRDTYAGDFMAKLEAGLLTPEEVVRWLEVGKVIKELNETEEELAEIRAQALEAELQVLENQLTVIDEQIAAQQKIIDKVKETKDAVENTFGRSIENIRLAGMDDKAKYEFFMEDAERLWAALRTSTDPDEIRRIMAEINDRINSAFNLLTPEEQAAMGSMFIEWLEKTLELGRERLDLISEEALTKQAELEEQRAAVMNEIAAKMTEAAVMQQLAAVTFNEGVQVFAQAAATPQPIQVVIES